MIFNIPKEHLGLGKILNKIVNIFIIDRQVPKYFVIPLLSKITYIMYIPTS